MVLAGGIFMSTVGVLLRFIEAADGYQILFYRSIGLCAIVWTIACIRRGIRPLRFLKTLTGTDWLAGTMLGLAFSFYVYSMLLTTIAVTLFLLSIAPFFAAILGWIFAGDKPTGSTWASMVLAVLGVAIMVYDGIHSGNLTGMVLALLSGLLFACMLVVLRVNQHEDSLGGTFIGGLVACLLNGLIALTLGAGLAASTYDITLSLFMGAFTIGIGIALVTWAAAWLPPAEVSILVLIESVLGPLWGWLIIGEVNSSYVFIGGAVLLGAVVLQASANASPATRRTPA